MGAARSKRISPQIQGIRSGCSDEVYSIAAKLMKKAPRNPKPRRKKVVSLAGAIYDNGVLR